MRSSVGVGEGRGFIREGRDLDEGVVDQNRGFYPEERGSIQPGGRRKGEFGGFSFPLSFWSPKNVVTLPVGPAGVISGTYETLRKERIRV